MMRATPSLALVLALLGGVAAAQEIRLEAQPEASAEAPKAAAPAPEAAISAVPSVRDSTPPQPAETEPAPAPAPLVTLRAPASLPDVVRMGPSLPEPGILRLTGEVASADLTLDLPAGVEVHESLQLTMRSSINVLPDTAELSISINDGAPVALPLNSFDKFATATAPAVGLRSGTNLIHLILRQPHRIFCGPEASFGVWTEIDLARSGVAVPAAALTSDARGFGLAVADQVGAGRPLMVFADFARDAEAVRVVTDGLGAAMQGRGTIRIGSFYETDRWHGPSVAVIASDADRTTYRRDGSGRLVMVVEHAAGSLPDLGDALAGLTLPAEAPVPMLVPGEVHKLADLGAEDIVGNTHYFRRDLQFRLPDDWLLLASQKAWLGLSYGFADDLPNGAILLVKVNDQTVRLLPLDRDGGRILAPLGISFGARLLHAGINTLSFEMMVPGHPADSACAARSTDMLMVTKESTLLVPRSPAMQWGGSSATLSGLTPGAITVDRQAAEDDRLRLAAAQLAAGLTPTDTPDPAVSLTLLDFNSRPPSMADVTLGSLQATLFPRQAAPADALESAAPRIRLSEKASDGVTVPKTATPAPSRWSPLGWIERQHNRLTKAAFLSSGEDLTDWLRDRQGDALLLPLDRDHPEAMGLLVGPQADMRGIGRALDGLRGGHIGVSGAALLSNGGTWQIWSPVQVPHLREPLTALNLFPVLGNYASWSPLLFTALLLGFGLASVIPALIIVIFFRKRRLR